MSEIYEGPVRFRQEKAEKRVSFSSWLKMGVRLLLLVILVFVSVRLYQNRNTVSFTEEAEAAYAAGRADEAIELWKKALETSPTHRDVILVNLGVAHANKNDHKQAAYYYGEAVKVNDRDVQTYRHLSESLRIVGDIQGAYEAIRRAAELDPSNETVAKLVEILRKRAERKSRG